MSEPDFPEPPDFPDVEDSGTLPVSRETVKRPTFETRFARFTADEYFAEPCSVPALSSSIAHVIDTESPLHAWQRHPSFGGTKRAPTKAMDNGSLSHALLLGAGKDIAIIKAKDYRTDAAKADRDAARDKGKIPVLTHEHDAALKVSDKIRSRFREKGIVLDGESELTALWTETASNGARVQCRGMIDHLKLPRIYDIKSIRSANPETCRKHIEEYGYAIQRAAYVSAVERIRPELAGRIEFIFVFYELDPPHDVTPIRLSGAFRHSGEASWRRSVNRWEECLRTNTWPGYVDSIVSVEPSKWWLTKNADRDFAAA